MYHPRFTWGYSNSRRGTDCGRECTHQVMPVIICLLELMLLVARTSRYLSVVVLVEVVICAVVVLGHTIEEMVY